jgi:hypothetical protein
MCMNFKFFQEVAKSDKGTPPAPTTTVPSTTTPAVTPAVSTPPSTPRLNLHV